MVINRKILLFIFFVIISSWNFTYSQSFTFDAYQKQKSDTLGSETIFYITVKNNTNDSLSLCFVRSINNLPLMWESSMCIGGICLAPFVDSAATSPDFGEDPIPPNDSIPFSLHIYPVQNTGIGYIRLVARNLNNLNDYKFIDFTLSVQPSGIIENIVNDFKLYQNFPNPFNPTTKINYEIQDVETRLALSNSKVTLKIYDVLGREIETLVNEQQPAGKYSAEWNATKYSSGIYYYELCVGNSLQPFRVIKKMMLVK